MRLHSATAAALLACCCCGAPPASAQPEAGASIRASFAPDRLGASTALTFAVGFSGGEEGVAPPLRHAVVHLPAGLGLTLGGVKTCTKTRVQSSGVSGCPSASLVGRGHAVMEVHAGSQTIREAATMWAFRGPEQGGHPVLEILGHGETPLDESAVSTAVLTPDSAPFGSKLSLSVPLIPTLVHEPDASFSSLSLTIGRAGAGSQGHVAAGTVLVPRSCPAGGFPFAAEFTFADGSTASATAKSGCP
jgi:hypothetical protein